MCVGLLYTVVFIVLLVPGVTLVFRNGKEASGPGSCTVIVCLGPVS